MAIFTGIGAAIFGAGTFLAGATAFGLQVAAGIGVNLLAKKVAGKKNTPQAQSAVTGPGFSVQGRLNSGGDLGRSFPLGWRITAGSLVYANTWGSDGDTPNAYLTQVIALSDLPVQGLAAVWVNGEKCDLGGSPHADFGYPVVGYDGYLWVKFYDGTQSAADAYLVASVSSAERPYESSRVGTGCAYAIVTARVNDTLFSGFPSFKFELNSVPLYDISKDTTAGGDGAHRWDSPDTWGGDGDDLPAVQIYNVLRGISYGGDWLYGLQAMSAARLPAATWIAQIEKCREAVDGVEGEESEPRYRSSLECFVGNESAETVEQILTACQGRVSEIGGVYKLHCGEPGAPAMSFTDADILSTEEQTFSPFFGLSDTINGINASYPEPAAGWNKQVAPPVYRTDLEALAGGRRLMADASLDAVPYARQVQQLMRESLQEAQRARRHTFVLPPKFWPLEPGDVVEWTSVRNGYATKLFRVDGVVDKANLDVMVDLTEIDPSDYDFDFDANFETPTEGSQIIVRPPAQAILDFDVQAVDVEGDTPGIKRPGILLTWDGGVTDDLVGVRFEVRRASDGEVIYRGRCDDAAAGSCIIEGNGILPLTEYEVRARYIPASPRETTWSTWLPVTTTDARFSFPDFEIPVREYLTAQIQQQITALQDLAASLATSITNQTALLSSRTQETRRVISVENGAIRASVSEVALAVVTAEAALASLTTTVEAHAESIVELTGDVAANSAAITTNATAITTLSSSLSSLTTTVSSHTTSISSLSGSITTLTASVSTAQSAITTLEGYAAARYAVSLDVNGYVTGFELINAGASYSTATFVVDYFRVAKPGTTGGSAVTVFEIGTVSGSAALTIKGGLIADGAIVARSIAANTITATHIAAGTITATEIAAGTITATQIASATITTGNIVSQAATQLVTATAGGGSVGIPGTTIISASITTTTANGILLTFSSTSYGIASGSFTGCTLSVELDGSEVFTLPFYAIDFGFGVSTLIENVTFSTFISASAGSHTVTVKMKANDISGLTMSARTLSLMESKR